MAGAYEHTAALTADLRRLTTLIGDAETLAIDVPGLDWTAEQVVAHLTTALTWIGRAMTEDVRTTPEFASLPPATGLMPNEVTAAASARSLEAHEPTDTESAVKALRAAGEELLTAIEAAHPSSERQTPWYGTGSTRTAGTIAAVAHGEILMHGLDIARALDRPWEIPQASAAPVAYAVFTGMAPYAVNATGRALKATFTIHIRGGERFSATFANGTMTVTPPLPRRAVQCHISVSPVAMLMTGYGRASQWPYIARGQMFAYGRRPWLSMRLVRCINRP